MIHWGMQKPVSAGGSFSGLLMKHIHCSLSYIPSLKNVGILGGYSQINIFGLSFCYISHKPTCILKGHG